MRSFYKFFLLLSYSIFVSPSFQSLAQEEVYEQEEGRNFEQIKLDRLKRIRTELILTQNKLFSLKKKMNSEEDMVTKINYESQITQLESLVQQKRIQFIETATSVILTDKNTEKKKQSFGEDLKDIFSPAIESMKSISERPRKIQSNKEKVEILTNKIEANIKAKEKLEQLIEKNQDMLLLRTYKRSKNFLENSLKDLRIQREDIQFKLLKLEQEKGNLIGQFSSLLFNFLQTKGKNLLLALLVFFIAWWLARISQKRFLNIVMYPILHNPKSQYYWLSRPIRVIYSVFTLLFAFSLSIMTLYVLDDWVLVTFILFVFGAVIWSSKQYLPVFVDQAKIVLNLGAIREGERVMFEGIPWQIKSLGFYVTLVNPTLSGGRIRVSTKQLINLYSRPLQEGEPWFPTRTGDWVELSSGDWGKVVVQTVNQIVIKKIGEELCYFNTSEFLALKPVNLSTGFSVEVIFGVDYQHQLNILSEIIPFIRDHLKRRIYSEFESEKSYIKELAVDYHQSGASSLDVRCFLKCKGELAPKKQVLMRKIQSYLVELCNEKGYVIPFNQLTVHMANAHEENKSPTDSKH